MKAASPKRSEAVAFATPHRAGLDEFDRDRDAFDGVSYLYANEDVRREIGFDPDGAWRHWIDVGHVQDRYPTGVARTAPRTATPHIPARPFGLNVFGPFDAISGLGTAARNLADSVARTGIAFELRPHDVETAHARLTEGEAARPLRYAINLVLANADQIRRLAGLYPDGTFDGAYTIAVWAWELPAFRADFLAAFGLVDEVWPNSRFERDAIAAISPVPVHLMPLPVPSPSPDTPSPDPDRRASGRALFGLPDDAYVFLCPFDAGSVEQRKNPFAALRAFRAAFGRDPRRVLVVKHHSSSLTLAERIETARAGAPNIRVIGARLSAAEMGLLQHATDALVSSHRSEGFGLNLAEFLAAGRAVVATDTSGSMDFLDASTGFPVPCRPCEIVRRAGPYLEHAVWAEPDEAALADIMAQVANDATARAIRGKQAMTRMAHDFSVDAIATRMRDRIAALGLADDPVPVAVAATSAISTERIVPAHPGRARLQWPARLPMFGVVLARDPQSEPTLASLVDGLYPFWEACIAADDWPATEDAQGRASARGPDRRIRLIEATPGTSRRRASIASIASYLVFVPPGCTLAADALFRVAHALDRDDAPDLMSLETSGTSGGGSALAHLPPFPAHLATSDLPPRPIVARKSLFLDSDVADIAHAASELAFDELLRAMAARARRITHLAIPVADLAPVRASSRGGARRGRMAGPPAGGSAATASASAHEAVASASPLVASVPEDAAVSLRFFGSECAAAWDGAVSHGGPIDVDILDDGARHDVRAAAGDVMRGMPAEHVVLIGDGVSPPTGAWLARLLPWLGDRLNGGLIATFGNEAFDAADAATGLFATTRTTLGRIARLETPPRGFADAVEMLGLRLVAPPDLVTRRRGWHKPHGATHEPIDTLADDGSRTWPVLSLDAHAAHLRGLGLFDAEHYLSSAPDVAASGIDPLAHYCEHGWQEHRAPNFYFDPVWYRACFMEARDEIDPLLHWERYLHSGVRPSRHFDPAWVRRACGLAPDIDPLRYFLDRRKHENISPLREFDPAWYRARRRDIAYRGVDPFEHYMRFGAAEGVNPSADFDTAYYARNHMIGLGRSDPLLRNPLLHYLETSDRKPAITSNRAALRQEIARLSLIGSTSIDLAFAWFDGLPQQIDALRAYLADPTLAMTFRIVFANEKMVNPNALLDQRLQEALRLPYVDDYDDPDICDRLAECVIDPRCATVAGKPILAFIRGGGGAALENFARRIAGGLVARRGIETNLVFLE